MIDTKALAAVFVMAAVTYLIRALPFLVLKEKETPAFITYLGKYLPYAIIGMLVVYCLKDASVLSGNHALPELLSILLIVVLHVWKRNTLLSIIGGTVCYMLLSQLLFL